MHQMHSCGVAFALAFALAFASAFACASRALPLSPACLSLLCGPHTWSINAACLLHIAKKLNACGDAGFRACINAVLCAGSTGRLANALSGQLDAFGYAHCLGISPPQLQLL